jgi:UDP-N-acetylglucosamine 3-dehydrogenase
VTAPVRCVLFGVGRMGKNHLRVVKQCPGFELIAIIDPERPQLDPELRGATPLLGGVDEISLDAFDAAFVAAPTLHHYAVVRGLIDAKKHVFVEKPLAGSFDECSTLVRAASRRGVRLAVGHVERFNPAVRKLREVIGSGLIGSPTHFSFTRVGRLSSPLLGRSNVLLELAVHDLDILRSLIGKLSINASTCHSTIQPGVFDTAFVTLSSESGISATIHVDWNAPQKVRTIHVAGTRGACVVDCIAQTCTIAGSEELLNGRERSLPLSDPRGSRQRVALSVRKQEPLRAQLEQFFRLLISGDAGELCLGDDASAAVLLAERGVRIARGRNGGPERKPGSSMGTTPCLD